MAKSLYIEVVKVDSSDTIYKDFQLNASTSMIIGTSKSSQSSDGGGAKLLVQNSKTGDNVTLYNAPKVSYLRSPKTSKHPNGTKFPNSLVIEIEWGTEINNSSTNYLRQEVLVLLPKNRKVLSVIWSGIKPDDSVTIINEDSEWVGLKDSSTLQVKINTEAIPSQISKTIDNLTLFNYYVSSKGYKTANGVTSNTAVGSYNFPGTSYHRETSRYFPGTVNYNRTFTFTPPSSTPNYYIVIVYKGWNEGEIGEIYLLSEDANSLNDKTEYWDYVLNPQGQIIQGAWGKYVRYSFYAVYDDGVYPALGSDYQSYIDENPNTHMIPQTACWVQFNTPLDLITIYWYKDINGSRSPLKDDNDNNLETRSVKSTSSSHIKVNTIPNFSSADVDPARYEIDYWYAGTSSSSWTSTNELTEQDVKDTLTNQDLYFCAKLKNKQYQLNFTPYSSTYSSPQYYNYNTLITLSLDGGTLPSSWTYNISFNMNRTPITLPNPTKSGYSFKGWSYSSDRKTYTAHWETENITVYYYANGGTGTSPYSISSTYNQKHKVKSAADVNFTEPTGKRFVKWNTEANGTGTDYLAGHWTSKLTEDLHLYAVWGTPWKKVKWIWIYNPASRYKDTVYPEGATGDAIIVDHGWERHKPWVNIK